MSELGAMSGECSNNFVVDLQRRHRVTILPRDILRRDLAGGGFRTFHLRRRPEASITEPEIDEVLSALDIQDDSFRVD